MGLARRIQRDICFDIAGDYTLTRYKNDEAKAKDGGGSYTLLMELGGWSSFLKWDGDDLPFVYHYSKSSYENDD